MKSRAGQAVKRSGARPGRPYICHRPSGKSGVGLELIREQGPASNKSIQKLLEPHFYPRIRLELGAWLAQHRVASSMMDISDGLSTDLVPLVRREPRGRPRHAERIPCVELPTAQSRQLQESEESILCNWRCMAETITGFSSPSRRNMCARLRRAPGFSEITQIGEIVSRKQNRACRPDGRAQPLKPGGWDPFGRLSAEEHQRSVQRAVRGCRITRLARAQVARAEGVRIRASAGRTAFPARQMPRLFGRLWRGSARLFRCLRRGGRAFVCVNPCSAASAGGAVSGVSTCRTLPAACFSSGTTLGKS